MYLAAIRFENYTVGCDRHEAQLERLSVVCEFILCVLSILLTTLLTTLFIFTIDENFLRGVALRFLSIKGQILYLARCAVVVRDSSLDFWLWHGQFVVGFVMVDKWDVYLVHGFLIFYKIKC